MISQISRVSKLKLITELTAFKKQKLLKKEEVTLEALADFIYSKFRTCQLSDPNHAFMAFEINPNAVREKMWDRYDEDPDDYDPDEEGLIEAAMKNASDWLYDDLIDLMDIY